MQVIQFAGSGQAVLMIHGLTGSAQQLEAYGAAISKHFGWQVLIPMLPGHGTTEQDLAKVHHDQWQQCVADHAEELLRTYPRIHIMGLSMGGLLCIDLLKKKPDKISSLVLLAPAFTLYGWLNNVILGFLSYLPRVPLNFMIPKKTIPGENILYTYQAYPFSAVQELAKLAKKVKSFLPIFCVPYFLAYSKKDITVGDTMAKHIQKYLINPNAVILELKDSHHVLPLAQDKDFLLTKIFEFYASLPP